MTVLSSDEEGHGHNPFLFSWSMQMEGSATAEGSRRKRGARSEAAANEPADASAPSGKRAKAQQPMQQAAEVSAQLGAKPLQDAAGDGTEPDANMDSEALAPIHECGSDAAKTSQAGGCWVCSLHSAGLCTYDCMCTFAYLQ
jgi:hypothetical protein